MKDRYHTLQIAPDEISEANILCRMIAGIGFRFYWATEDMKEETCQFRPCEGARSIGEAMEHIRDLLNWLYGSIDSANKPKPANEKQLREETLDLISLLEDAFSKMDNKDLLTIQILKQPFWPVVNGPLSDVLTHIGQIATLRRIAGSPAPASNPFEGTPPPAI